MGIVLDNFEKDKRGNSDDKNRKKNFHGVEQIKQVTYTVRNKIKISLIN
jgi:hypothetical protein